MDLKKILQSIFKDDNDNQINQMVQIFKDNKVLSAHDLQHVDKEMLEKWNFFMPIEINKIIHHTQLRVKHLESLCKKSEHLSERIESLQQKLLDLIPSKKYQKHPIASPGFSIFIGWWSGCTLSIFRKAWELVFNIYCLFVNNGKEIKIIEQQLNQLQIKLANVDAEIKRLSNNDTDSRKREDGHGSWMNKETINDDFPFWSNLHKNYFSSHSDDKCPRSLSDEEIYEHIQEHCRMNQHFVPFDAASDESEAFFFASENAEETKDKLLILMYGKGLASGNNRFLSNASPISYVKQAQKEGYEVILINTSQGNVKHGSIRGSRDPEEHASYVWDNFIMKRVKAKHIAIMAHSYGGAVTASLAEKNCFKKRVFAIGFSDSVHSFGLLSDSKVKDFLKKHARSWVTSEKELDTPTLHHSILSSHFIDEVSAGCKEPRMISESCRPSLFKFFEKKLKEKKQNEWSFTYFIKNTLIIVIIALIIEVYTSYHNHNNDHYQDINFRRHNNHHYQSNQRRW